MKHIIFVFSIIALAMLFGCSNNHSPISTGENLSDDIPAAYTADYQSTINGESYDFGNQTMIGAFQMIANPETHEIEVVPVNARTAMTHYDVTHYLKEPYCPIEKCWYVNVNYYDPVEEIYGAEIAIYNPTPYTGYDVRALFVELFDTDIDPITEELYTENDIIILNPDGWTKILDDEEEEPEMNPFILFNKEQVPLEWLPNPSRSFPPYSIDYEYVMLRYPSLAPAGPIYIILASFPDQAEEAIQFLHVEQEPPMDTSLVGFSYVRCNIFDHQGEDPDMHVYLSCPDVLGLDPSDDPIEVEFWEWLEGTTPERVFLGWEVRVENDEIVTKPGNYPALIRVETPNPDDFDTYFKFDFKIRRNPGAEGHTEYDAPIAWCSFETGDGEIFVSNNVFMRHTQNATNEPDFLNIDPCWTKSGGLWYLYYASDSQNHPFADPDEEDFDIYVQQFKRVDREMVPMGVPTCLTGNGFPGDERAPAIAPDNSFMVFQGQENENSDWEILKGTLDPSSPTGFTSAIQNLTDNGAEDENPTVNAHSNYILFDSDMYSGNTHDICGMTPTVGSDIKLILESSYNDTEPAFNPDISVNYNVFAFTREDDNNCDIGRAVYHPDGAYDLVNLTLKFEDSDEKHATWSPSGSQLMFQSDKGDEGDNEIWSMDFDGSPYDQLTWNETDDVAPAWGQVP
ncbi:PD40 domain-containing protein [bacterium]|nr:PD40 domain-containing protein [bacterium]